MNEHDDLMMRVAAFCYGMVSNVDLNGSNSVFAAGYKLAMQDILAIIEAHDTVPPLPPNHDLEL